MDKRTMITFCLKTPQIKELNKMMKQKNPISIIGDQWALQYLHYTDEAFELLPAYEYEYFLLHTLQEEQPNQALEHFILDNTSHPQISYDSSNNMLLNIKKMLLKKESPKEFVNRNFDIKRGYFYTILHLLNSPFQEDSSSVISKVGKKIEAYKACLTSGEDIESINSIWSKISDYLSYQTVTIDNAYLELLIQLRNILSKSIN